MEETNSDNDDQITNGINDTTEEEDDEDSDVEYEGEFLVLTRKDGLERLKQNDQSITYLSVQLNCDCNGECFFNSIDWKEDGDCISNNTHIKGLHITYHGVPFGRPHAQKYTLGEQGDNLPTKEKLQDFFSCIYRNSSIRNLGFSSVSINNKFSGRLLGGLGDHPSLKSLEFEHGYFGSLVCGALGKVLKHPKSKLKELRLSHNGLDNVGIQCLSDALLGISRMKMLCISYNHQITSDGWRALSTVLQSPNCKLVALDISNTGMNDEGVESLGSTLNGSTIEVLNLVSNKSISKAGWHKLLNHLSQTSIVHLNIGRNKIDNGCLAALVNIGTLKSLDLLQNESITPSGWCTFFNLLQRIGTQLVKLDISRNKVGEEGAVALGNLLRSMTALKTLEMNSIASITVQVWISFFNALQDTNLDLESLSIYNNKIDDEGIQLLVQLVSSMNSLKVLRLIINRLVTPTGWQALAGYLQSPNLLEELDIGKNNINDDTVVALTNALSHNKTLTHLSLEDCFDEDDNEPITARGWEAVATLVCNKTSIMDTYNSNHTLQYVSFDQFDETKFPVNLGVSLMLNGNKDKVEVARRKILQTHFSTGDDTSKLQELLDMELEVVPAAISWIGRPAVYQWKGKNISGLSTMYNLLRRLPDLFDTGAAKKKSQRGRVSEKCMP